MHEPTHVTACGGLTDLDRLADEITSDCARIADSLLDALLFAINAGQKLKVAKAQLGHGEWLPWLEANTPVSARTAQRWMQLHTAQAQGKLEANGARTIAQAVEVISDPKPQMRPDDAFDLDAVRQADAERQAVSKRDALARHLAGKAERKARIAAYKEQRFSNQLDAERQVWEEGSTLETSDVVDAIDHRDESDDDDRRRLLPNKAATRRAWSLSSLSIWDVEYGNSYQMVCDSLIADLRTLPSDQQQALADKVWAAVKGLGVFAARVDKEVLDREGQS
jgi:hypothetical protein